MVKQVFSVYDSAARFFSPPFLCHTVEEACRQFDEACDDDRVPFKKSPGDYFLFRLGEFDDSSGAYEGLTAPEKVRSALQAKKGN